MSYKKPQIVARSAAKQTFVAACAVNRAPSGCYSWNKECEFRQQH